ncbi:MAG: hypothetical protein A2365_02515 [Candidatus Nealsonbacteria bacterium RIFOXYB1_FULL_40_15]|uniref:Uncharacterized protein n=2 Tax=Candidatus Nealsoniibacteriota TaxID=1817911 RepID=A0A1G2ERR8_9BACT|nr:MAG: hypothetical protein A2365_02515 [Candidatus Nealsonbacteria bacterium RIFOXYB1_FULL_40_15]OGZ28496.1 MAG: hypothetical protein A2427_02170 [Candidatus Nealsonbacteria bacterium RIFOXYC1_FULL_40_7]OGZ28704.1 MAG: hypothetical protein A2562_00650 [Candidatus Nealsonbacteria bacterium RIFOXYD1_FULL_39_11]
MERDPDEMTAKLDTFIDEESCAWFQDQLPVESKFHVTGPAEGAFSWQVRYTVYVHPDDLEEAQTFLEEMREEERRRIDEEDGWV